LGDFKYGDAVFSNSSFKNGSNPSDNDLFFSPQKALAFETPDLKIIQDNFVFGVSVPRILSTQTLGSMFGSSDQNKREVTDYTVEPGDTIDSLAEKFKISANTIAWANSLSRGSALKVGQSLTILPVSGLIHVVKSGDTISDIAKTYKAKVDAIVDFNNLSGEGDIFIGDLLIIPDGVMPQKSTPLAPQNPVPDSFFIYPAEGVITQGLHYFNAVDVANKCGTPIYATASGTVQRAIGNGGWNFGMGNHITILHSGGITTYYGHLMTLFVKPGDRVSVGDRIGLMGETGKTTGCHVHFQVIGARNPLGQYSVGTKVKYK
jgi:murein DD-endopeptidase MepM/ murein hydrolase activator NlpD